MKKIFLILTVIAMASCSRQADQVPPQNSYFSKVTRWKDGRTPAVDTVWTLRLFSQNMVDSFARYNGYIYFESTTFTEQGVLWSK